MTGLFDLLQTRHRTRAEVEPLVQLVATSRAVQYADIDSRTSDFFFGAAATCHGDANRDDEEPARTRPLSRLIPQVARRAAEQR